MPEGDEKARKESSDRVFALAENHSVLCLESVACFKANYYNPEL